MALFGFNKQKVLASAEKYVQQGKLQNAISEYEKIIKHDAKDLTVTNTVGDLYSRLGETDKATECFKTVGDAYASQGFTVKAIAMYKKICKLKPSLESLLKLAELYTQQGLFNDARAQYIQVAEEFLKNGELENAVRIFQKILEMDPENAAMRVRLADVYVRLGKKNDAWQIFAAAAEALRAKGNLSGAEEILQRMLTLDPGNTYALVLQGRNLLESGDAAGAVTALQKVPDLDSNKDGLRDLLKAYLLTGQLSDAGTVANKLLTVHNDLSAIATFADALMQAGQFENALQVFDQHAERLLAENSDKVLESLHTIIGHVRENPASLEKLLDLFSKAGETTHISEVTELLAHASVQAGDLPRARDLYQKLAQLEPQNPLHMQNYQQVVSQLGGSSGSSKLITPEEAVVLLDELEATAPPVHQHYTDEVALAVRSALTDAELFISYNMPAKALGPLLSALPLAPHDLHMNQRLAALHTRSGRFAEAALCCRTLQHVYSDADLPEEATRYGELADRYEERGSAPVIGEELAAPDETAAAYEEESAEEISINDASTEEVSVETEAAVEETPAAPWPTPPSSENEFPVADESTASIRTSASEIDLSSEWDDAITIDADEVGIDEVAADEAQVETTEPEVASAQPSASSAKVDEAIEEIRFYLEHDMAEQAGTALNKLLKLAPQHRDLNSLRGEVEAAVRAAAERASQAAEPVVEEIDVSEIPSADASDEDVQATELPTAEPSEIETESSVPSIEGVAESAVVEAEAEAPAAPEPPTPSKPVEIETLEPAPEPAAETTEVVAETHAAEVAAGAHAQAWPLPETTPVSSVHEPALEPVSHATVVEPEPVSAPVDETQPKVAAEDSREVHAAHKDVQKHEVPPELQSQPILKALVNDLEAALPANFLPGSAPKSAEPAPVAAATQPGAEPAPAPVLGEMVHEIEAALGDDFLKGAPVVGEPPAALASQVSAANQTKSSEKPPEQPSPIAAAAAASASASPAQTVHAIAAPVGAPSTSPAGQEASVPLAQAAAAPAVVNSPVAAQVGVDLAEMFGDLKQDLEGDVSSKDDDPETHYNLGVAFREMGLLDEAIGEMQKVCQSIDRGYAFPQVMQTYTWLAHCFLEKNVPEAAVRWYEKALKVPDIDGETRLALTYELASSLEASGDKPSALKNFLTVYGTNIDYRDVSERIRSLKS